MENTDSGIMVLGEIELGDFLHEGHIFRERRPLKFLILQVKHDGEYYYRVARNPLGLWMDQGRAEEAVEELLREAVYRQFLAAREAKKRDRILEYFFEVL